MSSRAYTAEEVRSQLLKGFQEIAEYWSRQEGTDLNKCEGVVFSILNVIDGTSSALPVALNLQLAPHPSDAAYHIQEGEDYYEPGMVINEDVMLHEIRKDQL